MRHILLGKKQINFERKGPGHYQGEEHLMRSMPEKQDLAAQIKNCV